MLQSKEKESVKTQPRKVKIIKTSWVRTKLQHPGNSCLTEAEEKVQNTLRLTTITCCHYYASSSPPTILFILTVVCLNRSELSSFILVLILNLCIRGSVKMEMGVHLVPSLLPFLGKLFHAEHPFVALIQNP